MSTIRLDFGGALLISMHNEEVSLCALTLMFADADVR